MSVTSYKRDPQKEQNVSANYAYPSKKKRDMWRSKVDRERVADYKNKWKLYKGIFYQGDGGPWRHPYGDKGVNENILYRQSNILGKGTRCFSDLVVGEGIKVTSEDEKAQEILDGQDFKGLWEALIMSSVYGFVGIQPFDDDDKKRWISIKPHFLYPEFHPSRPGEVISIKKAIPFRNVDIGKGKEIDVLYEETHTPGLIETRLWKIEGEYYVGELSFDFYKEYIDKNAQLPTPQYKTNLPGLMISLIFNDKIEEEIFGDYTLSAQREQEALNCTKTQIGRILKMNADPKLITPQSAIKQNPETGAWGWKYEGCEVLVQSEHDQVRYEYLTWNGELQAAENERDKTILAVHTEIDLSPQLTGFTHLVGGTTAETSAKLKQLLHATIKRAGKKRDWAKKSIVSMIENMLILSGIKNPSFSIEFPAMIPEDRSEVINEVISMKQSGLISTVDGIIKIEKIDIKEAEQKAAKIFEENLNDMQNPYSIPEDYTPPIGDDNAAKAMQDYLANEKPEDIARKYGVSVRTIYKWIRE